jgi:hypothetical protein
MPPDPKEMACRIVNAIGKPLNSLVLLAGIELATY